MEQRGFAAAGTADNGYEFALFDSHVNAVQGLHNRSGCIVVFF
jgi:hypothetical protein